MIFNMTGGASGCTLTVTAPAGAVVTASKDGKVRTSVAAAGEAVLRGLEAGVWEVSCTDGVKTSQPQTVTVTTDYALTLTFFAATIHVAYPAGSTCTATDGVTTLTAPDTSGTWECTVPNGGTWAVTATDGDKMDSQDVEITTDGQSKSAQLAYLSYYFKYGEGKVVPWTTTKESAASVTFSSSGIVFSCGSWYYAIAHTSSAQDLSKYTTLYFDMKVEDGQVAPKIGVASKISSYTSITWAASKDVSSWTGRTTYSIDIGSVSSGIIAIHCAANPTVYNVWAE